MSLKNDLAGAPQPKSGPPCMTCTWYDSLTDDDREAFDEFVAVPNYNRALLYRVISGHRWGFAGCESSLKYHLANHCGTR